MQLNIYWHFLCCDSLHPIDEHEPKKAGMTMNNNDDPDDWSKIMSWRDWGGCPECFATEPLIDGRKFIIT